jgi:hypothetical protein
MVVCNSEIVTQHWLESARDCELLGADQTNELIVKYEILGRKLYNTIEKAHLFCSGN